MPMPMTFCPHFTNVTLYLEKSNGLQFMGCGLDYTDLDISFRSAANPSLEFVVSKQPIHDITLGKPIS